MSTTISYQLKGVEPKTLAGQVIESANAYSKETVQPRRDVRSTSGLRWASIGVILLVASIVLLTAASVSAQVGILGAGTCSWSNITDGIAAASAGDTLILEEGVVFTENLGVIAMDLTIRSGTIGCTGVSAAGAPLPVIDGGNSGRVATIAADVGFRQLVIRDGEVTEEPGANLLVTGTGDLELVDVTVEGAVLNWILFSPTSGDPFGAGIHVESGGNVVIGGTSVVAGNLNHHVGSGGIMVEAHATVVLEDQALVGLPIFWPNTVDFCCGGGAQVLGRLEVRDNAMITFNNGGLAGGGIYVWENGEVELYDNAIIQNNSATSGGGIKIGDQASVIAAGAGDGTVVIRENQANEGGGINMEGGSLDLTDVEISDNSADAAGGGIWSEDIDQAPAISLHNVDVVRNTATGAGGGVAMLAGTLTSNNGSFSDNSSDDDGGGLWLSGSAVDVNLGNTHIEQNQANNGGGMAVFGGGHVDLPDTKINANEAIADGGGIYLSGADSEILLLGSNKLNDNTASRGGALFASSGEATLLSSKIRRNSAATEGGAIRTAPGASVYLSAASVTRNTAGTMGGAFAIPNGLLTVEGANLKNNSAGTDGGAVTVAINGTFTAYGTWFHSNTAQGLGGALAVLAYDDSSNPTVNISGDLTDEGCVGRGPVMANEYCSEFRDNHAVGGGGAVYAEDGNVQIYRTAFLTNTTDTDGAAVLMDSQPFAAPFVLTNNILSAGNGNDPNQDVIRVAGGSLIATHATSVDNTGTPLWIGPGASPSAWLQSIAWDTADVVVDPAVFLTATCSMFRAVTGTTVGPNRDFGLDPLFVTTARGDYRLDASVSVNAVDQCNLGLPLDTDSTSRPQGLSYDRGAFEAP